MAAGNARVDALDGAPRHQLGLLHRALDRLNGRFDVDHHALLHASGRVGADADDLQLIVAVDLSNDGGHLVGADVQADDLVTGMLVGTLALTCHSYRPILLNPSAADGPPAARANAGCAASRQRTANPRSYLASTYSARRRRRCSAGSPASNRK